MSPEQLRAQDVDPRADLYALGCVAYEMLTGAHAFRAASATELAAKHLYETPPQEPLVAVGAPPAFIDLVLRCLQKDPAARFQSTAELRAALEALPGPPGALTATPVPAVLDPTVRSGDQPPPASLSFAPGSSSRPIALAVGAGLLGMVVAWAILSARAREPEATPPPPIVTAPASASTQPPPLVAVPAPDPTPPTPNVTTPTPDTTPPPPNVTTPTPALPAAPAPPPLVAPAEPAPPAPVAPAKRPRPGKRLAPEPPPPETAPPSEPPPQVEPPPPPPPVPEDSNGFEKRHRLKDPFETKK